MANQTENYYEQLAVNVAADVLTRIARTAEMFLASGTNPAEPHAQKVAQARIDDLRKKMADGRVRPWFTRELTAREKLDDFNNPATRRKNLSEAKGLDEVKDYYTEMSKLQEKGQ